MSPESELWLSVAFAILAVAVAYWLMKKGEK